MFAALLAALFCAEAFNQARHVLAEAPSATTPGGLVVAWSALVIVGSLVAFLVARRFIGVAAPRRRLPKLAYAAVLAWASWQVLAIVAVAARDAASGITPWVHAGAALLA